MIRNRKFVEVEEIRDREIEEYILTLGELYVGVTYRLPGKAFIWLVCFVECNPPPPLRLLLLLLPVGFLPLLSSLSMRSFTKKRHDDLSTSWRHSHKYPAAGSS